MNRKKLVSNVLLSIIAQIISMIVGIVLNLVVPKFIPELSYANWQTYVLYSSYVGLLHFGILDGIVLRYSQYDYDQLNKKIIRSQFNALLSITTIIFLGIAGFSFVRLNGDYFFMVTFVALSVVVKNLYTYTSYTFQITNRINKYAYFVIADRMVYGIIVLNLLVFNVHEFQYYCIADLASDMIAIVAASFFNKGMYFGNSLSLKETVVETKINIASGSMLLIANWSANFLVGSSKMIIQWHWNPLIFGKVSFAFSLSSLILQFVNAISVVLFSSLKRLNIEELPALYKRIRGSITPILFISILLYFPMIGFLRFWIPVYASSIKYLGILFPMIIYTAKVSLLTNNFFKAYRKEKQMLIINLVTVAIAFFSFLICAYVINSLEFVLIDTVLVIMLRSVVSEIFISKTIIYTFKREYIYEAIMTAIFIIGVLALDEKICLLLYLVGLVVYLVLHKNDIVHVLSILKWHG